MSKIIVRAAQAGSAVLQDLIWRRIKVHKSLDEICHTLELELPYSEREKVHKHDKIRVCCFNANIKDHESLRFVTTVLADEITSVTDTKQKTLMVLGRSPARDIIDSAWSDTILQTNLEGITKKIAAVFGIDAVRQPNLPETETKKVTSFSWVNESPWTKLLAEAENWGYLFTSNEAGGLYLWKGARDAEGEGFYLSEGENIRRIQTTENGAEQYHKYVVCAAGHAPAEVTDPTCRNNRILTINLTDLIVAPDAMRRRALTEMRRRKERRVTVTVSGWGLNDEAIRRFGGNTAGKEIFWNPNFLIPVKMPSLGLDVKLLISEVDYEADTTAVTCTVTLVNKEAYQ
jgi:prophage tail gpP-like protein